MESILDFQDILSITTQLLLTGISSSRFNHRGRIHTTVICKMKSSNRSCSHSSSSIHIDKVMTERIVIKKGLLIIFIKIINTMMRRRVMMMMMMIQMTKTFRKSQVEQDIGLINQERNKISISRHMVNQRELSSSSQASSLSRQ